MISAISMQNNTSKDYAYIKTTSLLDQTSIPWVWGSAGLECLFTQRVILTRKVGQIDPVFDVW